MTAALDDYEQQAQQNNPGLQAAVARVKESRAMQQTARSALFPQVSAGFGPSREKALRGLAVASRWGSDSY